MPNPKDSSEVSAIEAAYTAEIQELFKVLLRNLILEPNSPEADQQSLSKFTAGLSVAKRARQLAVGAVAPSPATKVARRAKPKAK